MTTIDNDEEDARAIAQGVREERFGQAPGVIAQAVVEALLLAGYRRPKLPVDLSELLSKARSRVNEWPIAESRPDDIQTMSELVSTIETLALVLGSAAAIEWYNTKTGTVYDHVEDPQFGYRYVTTKAGSRYIVHAEFVEQRATRPLVRDLRAATTQKGIAHE